MLFNSWQFAIFLPLVFFFYWFVFNKNLKLQNVFMLCVSYFFYGYWDWRFLLLIALTSFLSWWSGLLIEKARENDKIGRAKLFCGANIVVNLAILGVFKYYNFFIAQFMYMFYGAGAESWFIEVLLPVGISFYTFQALSYSIDVYRGNIGATRDIVQFFTFLAFFPQLVAGPIERATNLLGQFAVPRVFDYDKAVDGLRQMLWGFFKKMVIADNCGKVVDAVWTDYATIDGSTLLLAAVMFSFQIYGDFSGYSDIAIGTARLFGIKLCRNFNIPYLSRDIAEFWRRWHISLNTWFRDYLYIPLGGSRGGKWQCVRNTFVIFIVSGFWHGANWTFICWGLFHAMLFLPILLLGKNRKNLDVVASDKTLPTFKELFNVGLTFVFATIGWIIFRAPTITDAFLFCEKMLFDGTLFALPTTGRYIFAGGKALYLAIVFLMAVEWFGRKNEYAFEKIPLKSRLLRWVFYFVFGCFILQYNGGADRFIYFQF